MIAPLQDVLHQLRDAYGRGGSLALLFDYDGTLTPIVEHPRLATLDDRTGRLLAALADRPRIRVGILSGRKLDELKSLVPLHGLYFSGTGGMELDLRGRRLNHPHADHITAMIDRLADYLEGQLSAYPNAWIETKGLGLTVHYRQTPAKMHDALRTLVVEAVSNFTGELRLVPGPKAWEVTPDNGWSKGTAVRLILADFVAATDMLFYAGDGANDSEAIAEVAEMGGITVGIGPDAPEAAEFRLPDHAVLRDFLGRLDDSLEKGKPHFSRSSTDCEEPGVLDP